MKYFRTRPTETWNIFARALIDSSGCCLVRLRLSNELTDQHIYELVCSDLEYQQLKRWHRE